MNGPQLIEISNVKVQLCLLECPTNFSIFNHSKTQLVQTYSFELFFKVYK